MLATCYSFTFAITEDNKLYSWGNNNYGQLGLNHNIHQNKPQLVNFFQDKNVNKIICGDYHTFAIVDNGVFSWGNNYYGQLGLGHYEKQNKPQLVEFFKDKIVNKIICGSYHTFAIIDDGSLFSWGKNEEGQLGLGHNEKQNKPQLVEFFKDKYVNKIICGSYHTFAILDDRNIYSWGNNNPGQLGLGHNTEKNKPEMVDFFQYKIVNKIICKDYHTFAIVNNGSLFSWGFNRCGQLGLGHYKNQNEPQLVEFFKDKYVNKIICGVYHTFAIVDDGEVFSWGNNHYGQLGLGHNIDQNKPQLVNFFQDKNVNKIICGDYHTFAIVDDGEVFSWGNNNTGQLGLGHNFDQNKPRLVDFFEKTKIMQSRKTNHIKSANSYLD